MLNLLTRRFYSKIKFYGWLWMFHPWTSQKFQKQLPLKLRLDFEASQYLLVIFSMSIHFSWNIECINLSPYIRMWYPMCFCSPVNHTCIFCLLPFKRGGMENFSLSGKSFFILYCVSFLGKLYVAKYTHMLLMHSNFNFKLARNS